MNINTDDKKMFIYKNINIIKTHNVIIKYIETNNIKKTINDNGFFVNISLIDDHIDNIYNILKYYLNNDDDQIKFNKEKKTLSDSMKPVNKRKYDNLSLDSFTESEQQIIRHSKQYKI